MSSNRKTQERRNNQTKSKPKQASKSGTGSGTNKFELQAAEKLHALMRPLVESAEIPRDPVDDHYVLSFSVNQTQEILDFFDEFGFVVVRDVLTQQECQNTISEVFDIMEETAQGFNRNDTSTWATWPAIGMEHFGTFSRPPIFRKQFIENRVNDNVYTVFKTLLNEDNLLVNHDRACFYRPTLNVPGIDESVSRKWATSGNVHLDMNPWHWITSDGAEQDQALRRLRYGTRLNEFIFENNQVTHHDGLQLQAVLNLEDNYEEDGGFVVVPFFHKIYDEYFTNIRPNGDLTRPSHSFGNNDPVYKYAKRISMRPGSMVVWSQKMPHGSFPNASSRPRIAQFLKMFQASHLTPHVHRAKARAATIQEQIDHLPVPPTLSPNARALLGL